MGNELIMPISSSYGAKAGSELRGIIDNIRIGKNIAVLVASIVAFVVIVIDSSAATTLMLVARLLMTMAGLYRAYTWL